MKFSPEEFEQILSIFQEETTEIINRFTNRLMSLEKNPDDQKCVSNLFQDAHSIKGAARLVGFTNIQNIVHKIEDVLTLLKEKKVALTPEIIERIYKASNLLLYLVENSIKFKDDFYCDSIISTINLLDEIIESKNLQSVQNIDEESEIKMDINFEENIIFYYAFFLDLFTLF